MLTICMFVPGCNRASHLFLNQNVTSGVMRTAENIIVLDTFHPLTPSVNTPHPKNVKTRPYHVHAWGLIPDDAAL